MTDLQGLIERLEKAEGPDRGIDRAIAFHVLGEGVEKERKLYAEIGDAMWVPDARGLSPYDRARGDTIRSEWQKGSRGQRGRYVDVRRYSCDGPRPLTDCKPLTASIDAALAFSERMRPDWCGLSLLELAGSGRFTIQARDACDPRCAEGSHAKPAMAILIATLRALMGKEGED